MECHQEWTHLCFNWTARWYKFSVKPFLFFELPVFREDPASCKMYSLFWRLWVWAILLNGGGSTWNLVEKTFPTFWPNFLISASTYHRLKLRRKQNAPSVKIWLANQLYSSGWKWEKWGIFSRALLSSTSNEFWWLMPRWCSRNSDYGFATPLRNLKYVENVVLHALSSLMLIGRLWIAVSNLTKFALMKP